MTELRKIPTLEHKKKKATFSMSAGPAEGVKKPVKAKIIRKKKTRISYVTEASDAGGLRGAVNDVKYHMVRGLRKYGSHWKSFKR